MKFDPTKPVQTVAGYQARVVITDAKGDKPIIALVTCEDDECEEPIAYYADGSSNEWAHGDSDLDLVNVPIIKSTYRGVTADGKMQGVYAYKPKDFAWVIRFDMSDDVLVNVEVEQ